MTPPPPTSNPTGKDLVSIRNSVTKTTTACFEPSLDYCVVKVMAFSIILVCVCVCLCVCLFVCLFL